MVRSWFVRLLHFQQSLTAEIQLTAQLDKIYNWYWRHHNYMYQYSKCRSNSILTGIYPNLNCDNFLKLGPNFQTWILSLDHPEIRVTSDGRLRCKLHKLKRLRTCISIAVWLVLNTYRKDTLNSISSSQAIYSFALRL